MKDLAPVCLFTYNRLDETTKTIDALKNNFLAKESELIVFSDGAKSIKDEKSILKLRNYLKTVTGFKSTKIIESKQNKGLASSIIQGVSEVINKYGKVIVLEDDLVSTPNFLDFMNQALEFYNEHKIVQSVNGFSLKIKNNTDIYFHERTFPWGWATWMDRWTIDIFDKEQIKEQLQSDESFSKEFNNRCGDDMFKMLKNTISGNNNSWYSRWVLNHFRNGTYAVYPKLSKINNIGFNKQAATHCVGINTYVCDIDKGYKRVFYLTLFEKLENKPNEEFLKYFKASYKLVFRLKMLKKPSNWKEVFFELKNKLIKI